MVDVTLDETMRIVIFRGEAVGRTICDWIVSNYPQDVVAIITLDEASERSLACSGGIPVFTFRSEDQILKELARMGPLDLGILAWWPKILTKRLLGLPQNGFINTHPSLLPHNRGKHYNFWAIVEQRPFGVSLHYVSEGVDNGDIVSQESIPYGWEDTGETLYAHAQAAMFDLFMKTYPTIREGRARRTPQELAAGSFHLSRELEAASAIDLDRSYTARELINLFRARTFAGKPGCWFIDGGVRYEVRISVSRCPGSAESDRKAPK
jgi:methionyl-tRNA formyltransferase